MNRVAFTLLVTALFGAGCAFEVPGFVDGLVSGSAFTIRDDNPVVRPQHDGEQLVVLADESMGELRLVQIRLSAADLLVVDAPLAVGPEGLAVSATFGPMEEGWRADGVRVLSTSHATTVEATSGVVTLASVGDRLAGELQVTLADGGSLTGEFVIER